MGQVETRLSGWDIATPKYDFSFWYVGTNNEFESGPWAIVRELGFHYHNHLFPLLVVVL